MDKEVLVVGLLLTGTGLAGVVASYCLGFGPPGCVSPTFLEGFHAVAGLVLAFGVILIPIGVLKGGLPTGRAAKALYVLTGLALLSGVEAVGVLNIFAVGPPTETTTTTRPPQVVGVSLVEGSFNPAQEQNYVPKNIVIVLGVNNTVKWTNKDTAPHTVTSSPNPNVFDSRNMNAGDVWEHTFAEVGTFNYVCTYHPWMRGSVTVKSG